KPPKPPESRRCEAERPLLEGLGQGGQELRVRLSLGQPVEEQLDALVRADGREHAAHRPDHLEGAILEEQLLAASARALHVDGREDALLRQLAVEDELTVAGALELLIDDVVHARAGIDEARSDDRERAALLDVPGSAEEALRRVEGDRVDAARERPAGRREGKVVRAREARDR